MLRWAVSDYNGPVAVRYPRGGDGAYSASDFSADSGICVDGNGSDYAIVTYGTLVNNVLGAAQLLRKEGKDGKVIRLTRLNPLPVSELAEALAGISRVMVAEETAAESGIYGAVSAAITELCGNVRFFGVNLGNQFVPHGDIASLYQQYGLDERSLSERMLKEFDHES